jgi:antitoxin (DNA-binding transcriptional repressor) of toxin-antitoxin stability system
MRRKATVRELRLKADEIVKQVVNGETYVIESGGVPVAELHPIVEYPAAAKLPDRESFLRQQPFVAMDSGRILEEDR